MCGWLGGWVYGCVDLAPCTHPPTHPTRITVLRPCRRAPAAASEAAHPLLLERTAGLFLHRLDLLRDYAVSGLQAVLDLRGVVALQTWFDFALDRFYVYQNIRIGLGLAARLFIDG